MKKKVVAIIPARMAASRFPGKPLATIMDLPMVEHVRRRVCLSDVIDDVYVATCDREILETVERFSGKAVMTKDTYERCTDRVEEAIQKIRTYLGKSNTKLSSADISIVALSFEFKEQGEIFVVITDDYSVQNSLKKMGISFQGVIYKEIKKIKFFKSQNQFQN